MTLTKFNANPLVVWTLALAVSYWTAAALLPGQWINAVVSATLTVAGLTIFATAVGEALRIIKQGTIGPGQLAVLGITILSLGSLYSGVFGIVWAVADYPEHWAGTAVSSFGKALNVVGYALVYLSPDATAKGIKRPSVWVILGGVVTIGVLAFWLGTKFPQL